MSEKADDRLRASCLCGKVVVTAPTEPDRVGVCHCFDCRKHHGALFFAGAIYPQEAVEVSGETRAYRDRHFCPECGSSLFGQHGGEIEIHLGVFDETDRFVPTYELWTVRREGWLPPFPGMAHHVHDRPTE